MRLGVSPTATTATGFFSQILRLYFPCTGALGCVVCLAPQLFLPVYLHTNVRPPDLLAAALPQVLSTPPAAVDECFFFISLVVGLSYSLIFWQFWFFFVFKFVVVLLVVRGGKVYLPLLPSWPDVRFTFLMTLSSGRIY